MILCVSTMFVMDFDTCMDKYDNIIDQHLVMDLFFGSDNLSYDRPMVQSASLAVASNDNEANDGPAPPPVPPKKKQKFINGYYENWSSGVVI